MRTSGSISPDLSSKHRAKSIPPVPHRFVADVDAALVQQVLDVSERKWKANVHHDRQANDLRASVKVLEGVFFHHMQNLRNRPARLKSNPSDKTRTCACEKRLKFWVCLGAKIAGRFWQYPLNSSTLVGGDSV